MIEEVHCSDGEFRFAISLVEGHRVAFGGEA
jgi:hypothetical protein